MPSRRTNYFPESGRGLGHVTPTIFGSTVGYPSDSLASCFSTNQFWSCAFGFWTYESWSWNSQSLDLGLEHLSLDNISVVWPVSHATRLVFNVSCCSVCRELTWSLSCWVPISAHWEAVKRGKHRVSCGVVSRHNFRETTVEFMFRLEKRLTLQFTLFLTRNIELIVNMNQRYNWC